MEDLAGVALSAEHGAAVAIEQGPAVLGELRHAGLPEVLLGEDVRGHRRPAFRHGDPLLAEDDGAIRVPDLGGPGAELDPGVGTLAFSGKPAGHVHDDLLIDRKDRGTRCGTATVKR